MKILIAGDWHSDLHEEELCKSFKRFGHQVVPFKWSQYFSHNKSTLAWLTAITDRIQNKFLFGPTVHRINRDFIKITIRSKPDIIFIYRGTHIYANTIRELKRALPSCKILSYNNDDPFSEAQPKYYWRHFLKSVPEYDFIFAYREKNIDEFKVSGAKEVSLLRSWYVPDRSFHLELDAYDKQKFSCDVVFAGHYEPDGRLEMLEDIVSKAYSLRLFGPTKYWSNPLKISRILRDFEPVQMAWGNDYNKALCGSKIALCFLSKLNRDTYTRRCFEIPATKTFLLSEYSDDLASLYKEGVEAEFFRNRLEMMEKIKFYLENPEARVRIANAGYYKAINSGYDIDSRLKKLLLEIQQ
ncbi:CgeB family protein [Candidatus Njordibacter sp. Uisw_002]|uniref:CgeB family protein n=1 Tax=Candidatus Njordibacter sp. Uisw_002 TaxID=3230971 RepID=UPI003D56C1CF